MGQSSQARLRIGQLTARREIAGPCVTDIEDIFASTHRPTMHFDVADRHRLALRCKDAVNAQERHVVRPRYMAALLGPAFVFESRGALQIEINGATHTFLPGSIGLVA